MVIHKGSCHCKRVKFEVEAPGVIDVLECNCSICSMTGYLHLIVPNSKFKLIEGKEFLTTYKFNTGVAKHTFCRICGIKSFYTPRSNPEGVSVNVNCLNKSTIDEVNIRQFDGQNWEKSIF